MSKAVAYEHYVASLAPLSPPINPTASTPETEEIRSATLELKALSTVTVTSLADWIAVHTGWVPVLGLVVGLSREKLKNALKHKFGTAGSAKLAKSHPMELVTWLDQDYDLVNLLVAQRARAYEFGDVLVARAGSRAVATQAGKSGRHVEDEIESIAGSLGLTYRTRTRFVGRNGRTAPCDLVIPGTGAANIVVAAKGFDSTGSKLTDALREIEEMADVRLPTQFVIAVIDGIGWKNRESDLRKIHALWVNDQIDGMYTLATLDEFRNAVKYAAQLRGIL